MRELIDERRWQEFAEQTTNDLQFLHLAFNEANADNHHKMRDD